MLSKLDIEKHLKELGFTMIPPTDLKSYKVIQFIHPTFKNSVYVKSTNRFPLVIHGKHKDIRSKLLSISGVTSDSQKPLYFNSNMKDFDKQLNKGEKPERFGLHFGFDGVPAFEAFISSVS